MVASFRSRLPAFARRHAYVAGVVPVDHLVVLLVELVMMSLLAKRFHACYQAYPVLTTTVANGILAGIADTVAQTLSASLDRRRRRKGEINIEGIETNNGSRFGDRNQSHSGRSDVGLELRRLGQDVDQEQQLLTQALEYDGGVDRRDSSSRGSRATVSSSVSTTFQALPQQPSFNFERLARFVAFGCSIAPFQLRWFRFLSAVFPGASAAAGSASAASVPLSAAVKRVAVDQIVFAPTALAYFFTFMNVTEGRDRASLRRKFSDGYLSSLKANYVLWPAAQMVNFRVMPLPLQLPFVSTVGIFWTAYLSLTNASTES